MRDRARVLRVEEQELVPELGAVLFQTLSDSENRGRTIKKTMKKWPKMAKNHSKSIQNA